jgi:GH15 family glucan-1,4-alpha-glucosidase
MEKSAPGSNKDTSNYPQAFQQLKYIDSLKEQARKVIESLNIYNNNYSL